METKDLTRDLLRDLIVDARCADRDGLPGYGKEVRSQIGRLWHKRDTGTRLDRYGWPVALKS